MNARYRSDMSSMTKVLYPVYIFLFAAMAVTGLAQMPIFKRYYVADIPGLGWLAEFYFTHRLHYIGAIVFLMLAAYLLTHFLLTAKKDYRLTLSAHVRIVFLAGIIITGVFRVLKNLSDVVFSPKFTLVIDISHLGFMMIYLFTAMLCLVFGSHWLVKNTFSHGKE
jgi:hypothetical protein